jgi:hypothetical protein
VRIYRSIVVCRCSFWRIVVLTRHLLSEGFNTSLCYLKGAENHFTQHVPDPAYPGPVDLWKDDAPAVGWNGTYGTFLFAGEAVRVIKEYGPKIARRAKAGSPEANGPGPNRRQAPQTRGMFIYLAFQNTHAPLQIPTQYCYNSTSSGASVSNKCPTEGPDVKHHSFCYCYDDENISETQSAATLRPPGTQDVSSSMYAHWHHDRHHGEARADIPSRVAAPSAAVPSAAGPCPGNRTLSGTNSDRHTFNAMAL